MRYLLTISFILCCLYANSQTTSDSTQKPIRREIPPGQEVLYLPQFQLKKELEDHPKRLNDSTPAYKKRKSTPNKYPRHQSKTIPVKHEPEVIDPLELYKKQTIGALILRPDDSETEPADKKRKQKKKKK